MRTFRVLSDYVLLGIIASFLYAKTAGAPNEETFILLTWIISPAVFLILFFGIADFVGFLFHKDIWPFVEKKISIDRTDLYIRGEIPLIGVTLSSALFFGFFSGRLRVLIPLDVSFGWWSAGFLYPLTLIGALMLLPKLLPRDW